MPLLLSLQLHSPSPMSLVRPVAVLVSPASLRAATLASGSCYGGASLMEGI